MRARVSPWRVGLMAAGLALSLAAVGCGDDDDEDAAGSGGASGSSGGTGGKSGSGAAGKAGGGAGKAGGGAGSAATPEQCITDTKKVATTLSADCVSCICNKNANAISKCSASAAACWGFINCYAQNGCNSSNQATCIPEKCSAESMVPNAITLATAAGPVLQDATCAAKCGAEEPDGGADAGN